MIQESKRNKAKTEIKKEEKKKAPAKNTENKKEDNPEEGDDDGADAESQINAKISSEILSLLSSTAWKEKKEGFTKLTEFCNANHDVVMSIQVPLIKYMKKILKGWKESNLNVLKEAFPFFTSFLNCGCITKKCAFHLITFYIEKIGDPKFNATCEEAVLKITESTGPQFSTNRILKLADSIKAAPILKGIYGLLAHMIKEFSIKLFPVKAIIELCKPGLLGNPAIKAVSTEVLKGLYAPNMSI